MRDEVSVCGVCVMKSVYVLYAKRRCDAMDASVGQVLYTGATPIWGKSPVLLQLI